MKKIFAVTKIISAILWGSLLVYAVLSVASPMFAHAQTAGCSSGNCVQSGLNTIGSSGVFPQSSIANRTVSDLIVSVIKIMLMVAGSIAVLFIIIGGFQYVTSAGNAEQAEKGRATLVNAIIGIIIIILSYVIINVVVNTVSCTNGGSAFAFSLC